MTLEYFHEKQLFVFLDYFWKFVILEKTGGSVERQMARLSEKLLYMVLYGSGLCLPVLDHINAIYISACFLALKIFISMFLSFKKN